MSIFQHHPDGHVIVRNGATYSDSCANFALDFGEAEPALPAGAVGRYYEPGVVHSFTDGNNVVAGGVLDWYFGNRAIAAIDTLLAAQAARNEAPPPPPPPDAAFTAPILIAAAFNLMVADGDISAVDASYNLAAIYIDVGQYMLVFFEPQADTDYLAVIIGGAASMTISEKATDYLSIEARDAPGGTLTDAMQFTVQVYRV
jgi:hypothetical protein